jgi:hypothetical protein
VLVNKPETLVHDAGDQLATPRPPSGVPSPKTTEVMVILTAKQEVTLDQILRIMPAEIRATVKLYLDGKIRQWYSKGDGRGVIFDRRRNR